MYFLVDHGIGTALMQECAKVSEPDTMYWYVNRVFYSWITIHASTLANQLFILDCVGQVMNKAWSWLSTV